MMTKLAVFMALGLMSFQNVEANNKIEVKYGGAGASSGAFLQTTTFSYNNILAWRALNGGAARLQNFPPHYLPGNYQITTPDDYRLPRDSQVDYWCAAGAGPCEVVVFLYECSPCKTKNGGLPAYLTGAHGYERTRCAPTFTTGAVGGATHKMTAFVKTIPENTLETITVLDDAEFVVFGLSNGNRPQCTTLGSLTTCEDDSQYRCTWHSAKPAPKCQLSKCTHQGPAGGCDPAKCVANELL